MTSINEWLELFCTRYFMSLALSDIYFTFNYWVCIVSVDNLMRSK